MRRRWRDLVWLLLILCVVGLGFRDAGVSHELDGQTYKAELRGYANTSLQLKDGSFTLRRHTCTGSGAWDGKYRLEGNVLYLCRSLQPSIRFELRKSAGRTYLDSSGADYDRTLKLTADATGGPRPPRWKGGPLRLNGLYPGMDLSALGPKLHFAVKVKDRAIYCSDQKDLAVSVKGNRVVAVGGPQLLEGDGPTLLEYGEKTDWIQQCLGQTSTFDQGNSLQKFPCGLTVGHGYEFFGAYFLGEVSEVVALQDAMFTVR